MKSKIDEAMFERNYAMDYAYDWGMYLTIATLWSY
jgi:hypothetical protein